MPIQWKHANVCAVHKKGKKLDPSNYRPVSLTCIASKVLEHVVHSHVMKHLSQYGVLTDYQHGFRTRRSTETQLICTIHDIASAIQSNKTNHAAILDFSKAFDKVKEKIHRAHIGIQGCLRRACEVVYWPSMNREITDYIEHCDTCNMYTSHPQREPLVVHDVPECPWQKVGCDIFTLDEKDYLCTVDYFSGYFEIDHLERKTARAIIARLKRHFSNHGIPNLFQSDNGPPFDSQEFRDFAAAYEFELVTSSPNYAQSNGRIENAVKTAKQLMKKSKQARTDFYLALLDWRNTLTDVVDCSPVQRLCGRRTRTLLPTATSLLKLSITPGVREKPPKKKERQTYYYNRGTRELSP